MLCVLNSPYSAQVVLVLFVSSHSITRRHQFQGYQIAKKKKDIYNKQREMDSAQLDRYCKVNTAQRNIGLILKIK